IGRRLGGRRRGSRLRGGRVRRRLSDRSLLVRESGRRGGHTRNGPRFQHVQPQARIGSGHICCSFGWRGRGNAAERGGSWDESARKYSHRPGTSTPTPADGEIGENGEKGIGNSRAGWEKRVGSLCK